MMREKGGKNLVTWRENIGDSSITKILESINDFNDVKEMEIKERSDDNKIYRRIIVYIERFNFPCFDRGTKRYLP